MCCSLRTAARRISRGNPVVRICCARKRGCRNQGETIYRRHLSVDAVFVALRVYTCERVFCLFLGCLRWSIGSEFLQPPYNYNRVCRIAVIAVTVFWTHLCTRPSCAAIDVNTNLSLLLRTFRKPRRIHVQNQNAHTENPSSSASIPSRLTSINVRLCNKRARRILRFGLYDLISRAPLARVNPKAGLTMAVAMRLRKQKQGKMRGKCR